ncbi:MULTISPECIES: hypothetical protein [Chitinophagaceae]
MYQIAEDKIISTVSAQSGSCTVLAVPLLVVVGGGWWWIAVGLCCCGGVP